MKDQKSLYEIAPRKSVLKGKGIENTKINHIANITIVDAYLNKRVIGSKSPGKYMDKFRGNIKLKETMQSHLIDIDSFGIFEDNYDLFYEKRIKLISDTLKSKIIKQDVDTIDELLSTSDPKTISELIAKIKNINNSEPLEKIESKEKLNKDIKQKGATEVPNVSSAEKDIDTTGIRKFELITVTKNKSSGKYFIYLEGNRDGNDILINPIGKQIPFDSELFEELEDVNIEELLNNGFINENQIDEYRKKKQIERYLDESNFTDTILSRFDQIRTNSLSSKTPSPSAAIWANKVQDLSGYGFKTWKEICDHLNLDVAGDSARRVLRRWVMDNRSNWPQVPELDSDYP